MLDNLKNKNKFGFSMFEVCVTMAIVVVFIAACSNVFTQKHKKRLSNPIHGHYECYRDNNGHVLEQLFGENGAVSALKDLGTNGVCTFQAPKYASFIVINAVAAGGNGGSSYGGAAGDFTNMFLSTTNETIHISPGLASVGASRGGDTVLYTGDVGNQNEFIHLTGGRSGENEFISFKSCSIAGSDFACGISPVCRIVKNAFGENVGGLSLSFCTKPATPDTQEAIEAYRTAVIPFYGEEPSEEDTYWFENDLCKTSNVDQITLDAHNSNRYIYPICNNEDCNFDDLGTISSSLKSYSFKRMKCKEDSGLNPTERKFITVNLMFDGNYTIYAEKTQMDGLVDSLGLSEGIAARKECYDPDEDENTGRCSVSTGSGAPIHPENASSVGAHGSVLITW